jgi:hypothetical protein
MFNRRTVAAALVAMACIAGSAAAHGGGVRIAVGFGGPYYPRPYYYGYPYYPPVYVGPPRVLYVVPAAPPPVYVQPAPYRVVPAPGYIQPTPVPQGATPPKAALAYPLPAPASEPPPVTPPAPNRP